MSFRKPVQSPCKFSGKDLGAGAGLGSVLHAREREPWGRFSVNHNRPDNFPIQAHP